MCFFQRLHNETESERQALLRAPIIERCFNGEVSREDYVAFLSQAYHHVKHTVPLLMAVGARLGEDKEWLREAVAHYIEEEIGHQQWILNDIRACGFDEMAVRDALPLPATELMVAYAYDVIQRNNPIGFFGMVLVLEGTSIALASAAAQTLQTKLTLPAKAFSYLSSHGALDEDHMQFFEGLMNRLDNERDKHWVIHAAKMFYKLYGDIFRSLDDVVIPANLMRESA